MREQALCESVALRHVDVDVVLRFRYAWNLFRITTGQRGHVTQSLDEITGYNKGDEIWTLPS